METIAITLDGVEVSGYPGMTILDLARESGVDIPTLCHDPHLEPIGACRLCVVEVERIGALMASCVTPIAPGMVVNTHSPRVVEHRRTIVKLTLASHPDSCLVCDKGNRCQLRQIASDLGVGLVEFRRIPQSAAVEEANPFIERDLSKCILCAKCIRACQGLVVEGAIDYFQRGFTAVPAALGDSPLVDSECTFCGTCVALCPTGALMEKEKIYGGTTQTIVETVCPFCGCGCNISLEIKDGRVVRVKPGERDLVNHGALCVRGSYGCDFIHSPDRLTKPLVKAEDGFEEVSWEQALEQIAAEFTRIKDKFGPDSLAVLGSSKCTNEENYLVQRFTRCVLGTNNIDNGSRLYNPATRLGLGTSIGLPGTTSYLRALEESGVIFLIGADPASSAPVVAYAIKRAVKCKGAKLILIDPRQTKLSSFAHLWLRPKVGTDVALLNSLAKVIIDEELLDEEHVARRTDNFEEFSERLGEYSPEYAEAVTGVSGDEVRAAARLYAGANQAAIVYGSGITQQAGGVDGVRSLANLAILTGNIGRGGIFALQRENNGQGACDMGTLPGFLPGYQNVSDVQARRKFEERWKVSLPSETGLSAMEITEQAKAGKIKGLYIIGENPVLSFPHSTLVSEALASLDFLVVQDMFNTRTARLADVVLPAASFAEKEGTFTNFEGRISRVRKAIEPVGDSLPDGEIILRLADGMKRPLPFSSLQQVMGEIEEMVPLYEGYTDSERLYRAELDTWQRRRTYGEQFIKGFARFSAVKYIPPADGVKEDYPFTLLTGTILYHFGTGGRSSRAWRLRKFHPRSFVEISESDAKKLAFVDGDMVRIASPVGEVTTAVKLSNNLPEGVFFMPISFPDVPVNRLFDIKVDAETKMPSLKACAVRIERVESDG
ncbi:formate dehydrogenase subunit alpha [Chloroflexota bacterium]